MDNQKKSLMLIYNVKDENFLKIDVRLSGKDLTAISFIL